ncbi:hypothetical protein B0H11DRAFT_2235720 [Mycena galericulata]|nr:hypothetical protein B0H11DRAFT_2235720 [Mycena galericulata]
MYDFIHREEEQSATHTHDESLVDLEDVPGSIIRVPRTAEQIRKAKYHKRLRLHARELLAPTPSRKQRAVRRIQESIPIFTSLDVAGLSTTSTAWLGVRVLNPISRTYTLQDLRDPALSMKFLEWDGWVCRPIIDSKNRLFALLAGRPAPNSSGAGTYQDTIDEATRLFGEHAKTASGNGRRGTFTAVSTGVSFGGGQMRPGNLLNSKANAAICAIMIANWALLRIIGFSNGYAPRLHAFNIQQMRLLYAAAPYLRRLFAEAVSVFAACTFNFGPNTVTLPHVDAASLAWGWCCITAGDSLSARFYHYDSVGASPSLERVNSARRDPVLIHPILRRGPVPLGLRDSQQDQAHLWEDGIRMFQVWNARTGAFEEHASP